MTSHEAEIEVLEEFREHAEGGGQVGALDSPSFVAAAVEWVVTSYFRAFEEIEGELEELDAKVMSDVPKSVSDDLARLVELRRSIGSLRRALFPHREVIVALAHPELDLLSTETSGERFDAIERRVAQAMDAAREAKESTRGSFDLLVTRLGQRTNDIMKVLTLVTVILLPATVLAGVMGMNFRVGLFDLAWMFWAVIAAMLGIAVLVLSVARSSALDLKTTAPRAHAPHTPFYPRRGVNSRRDLGKLSRWRAIPTGTRWRGRRTASSSSTSAFVPGARPRKRSWIGWPVLCVKPAPALS